MATPTVEYFQIPSICPVCSGLLTIDGQFLFCKSKTCPGKLSGAIRVWVERLGLLHWGDTLIDKLCENKISSISDLYRLSIEDIASCCSGVKFAAKCHKVLHLNKSIPLQLLISALNIPNLGISTATDIVSSGISTISSLLSVSVEDLEKVPNVGKLTAQKIYDGIQEKRVVILELESVLNIIVPTSGPLVNLSFCITGPLSKPRKAIEKLIMDAGGTVKSSVGSGVTHLVTNVPDTTSSKMQNAKKHGTQVISEINLYSLIEATN
jgi:DNA ligase (NAD+)